MRSVVWDPRRTRVFAVGVLRYPDGEHWPVAGRRDAVLLATLHARGVPAENIVFITDGDATVASVRARFDAHLAASGPEDTLWCYFAGHGLREKGIGSFALYDGPWAHAELFSTIERRFRGHSAILTADACFSGNLAVQAPIRAGRVAYAALTSSLSTAISTSEWTFTDCLIAGLEGRLAVDGDGDGALRLSELAAWTERRMAAIDGQLSSFVTTNGFTPELVLGPAVRKEHPSVGEVMLARHEGDWLKVTVRAVRGDAVTVHWHGYDDSQDSIVSARDVRPWIPTHHPPGTPVEALSEGRWYPATVLAHRGGMHLIHYTQYDASWDEWLAPERLRVSG
jgi:hypothetical protein